MQITHFARAKIKGHTMTMYCIPTPPSQFPYLVSTFYVLHFPRYSTHKILRIKLTTGSKVKSRLHHEDAHLLYLANVPTKYQPSIP